MSVSITKKKTRDRLTAMGIESFLPVQEEIHQWSDRRKKIERVVIPMMIFVHVDPAERAEVLTLSSVSRYMVLRGQSTPAVIPDEQMERFRFMLDYPKKPSKCAPPPPPANRCESSKAPSPDWKASW